MATLSTAALTYCGSPDAIIRAGLHAVMHDITALLAMAQRSPELNPCQYI